MPSAQDVYSAAVEPLPASERLRLATLILEGLTESAVDALDYSDQWSAEDLCDLTNFSQQHASETLVAE